MSSGFSASADPVLSVFPNPRLDPPPDGPHMAREREIEAVDLAASLGLRGLFKPAAWDHLEPSPGQFAVDWFADEVRYLGSRGFSLLLTIQVIDTMQRRVPSDLLSTRFSSSRMLRRFRALLDRLLPCLGRQVKYVSIGNEVDPYLEHSGQWKSYRAFLRTAISYLHSRAPWIRVGTCCTFSGATCGSVRGVALLNEETDVYIATYYPFAEPFDPRYTLRSPTSPLADFPRLIALANGKPVVLQEVGYPATSLISSETAQADFVSNVFTAWRSTSRAIPFLSLFPMHDFPPELFEGAGDYYKDPDNERLRAFVGSVGLRTLDGTPRPAWSRFVTGANALR